MQRALLAPWTVDTCRSGEPFSTVREASIEPERLLVQVLAAGLGPLWWQVFESRAAWPDEADQALHRKLVATKLAAEASYRRQADALNVVRERLDAEGLAHVVIKGAHLRERVYPEPALRISGDIDLLVAKDDRDRAVVALVGLGFTLVSDSSTVSHEVMLVGHDVTIDLHWDLLRPGRLRVDLVPWFLEMRRDIGTHWGPSDEATLWLLLVHPVFTKYAPATAAGLLRVLDVAFWLREVAVDWEGVVDQLDRTGTKTAAWAMLGWVERLTGVTAPRGVLERLRPRGLRRRYLQAWIDRDFNNRLANRQWLVRAGYTLPVHDTVADAGRFLRGLMRSKASATEAVSRLQHVARMDSGLD